MTPATDRVYWTTEDLKLLPAPALPMTPATDRVYWTTEDLKLLPEFSCSVAEFFR
ncbi:MAG: hypothetical protein MUF72_12290 [Elainella sp. Prado103]|nr:hypothetical protein [Elainella sp. Prado103]